MNSIGNRIRINNKNWKVIKIISKDSYIIEWHDYNKDLHSTRVVSLEDIQKGNIQFIDYCTSDIY